MKKQFACSPQHLQAVWSVQLSVLCSKKKLLQTIFAEVLQQPIELQHLLYAFGRAAFIAGRPGGGKVMRNGIVETLAYHQKFGVFDRFAFAAE